jgi:hypothetical protein
MRVSKYRSLSAMSAAAAAAAVGASSLPLKPRPQVASATEEGHS